MCVDTVVVDFAQVASINNRTEVWMLSAPSAIDL